MDQTYSAIKANMSSGGSGIPAGRDPHKDGDDRHAEKGDNYGDGQSELQMSGSSSGYQTTPNQQQTLTQKGRLSAHVGFTYGKSDQIISDPVSSTYKNEDKRETTNQGVASHNRNSEPQGGLVVMESPEDVLKLPLMTAGKQTNSLPEFRSIDYSGHFKVNVISKGTKKMILKMKTEEEQFVKFCHLFHCDVQLDMVKEVLQSDLKLDVIKGGYPPSVCTQSGASGPVDVTVKTILACFCYQLTAVNISSTPWDIYHVRAILSSLDSYQRGIVIGYEVSGDVATNDWLAGERGSIKSVTETLVQRLGPRSNPVQQSSEYQHIEPDSDAESALIALQERFGRADRGHQQTGQYVSEQEQQQGTDQITERTHGDLQSIRLLTTSQLKAEPNSCRYKPRVDGLDNVPPGVGDSGDSNSDHARHFSMGDRQVRATSDNELETISSQKVDVNQATVMSDRSASQQQLAEWSGQNVNSPPQGSMSTPVDQSFDRCQGQGQSGVHRDSVRVQTGGQHAEVQNMSSPTTVDHYTLPQGQLPSTKPDVHHEAETSTITKKINLGRLEENILYHLPLLEDLRYKFQHVALEWKKGWHNVTITGDEVDVRQIKTEIEKQLKAVKEDKVEIDSKQMKQEALNMFREKSVLDYLTEHIRSLKVACYLTKNEDSNGVFLCIYAADTDIERAVRLVTSSVVCRETELNSTWRLFLESQYVQQELSDLQKEYNGKVSITIQEGLVTVSCTTDIENAVLTTVDKMKDDFFSERTKTVEYTPGGDLTVELCTKVLQNDIQMIEEKYCVKCCPVQNNRKQGWKVTGPCGTVEKACNALKELSTTVTSRHLPIVDKITEDFFRTQTGQDDMARVGQNTGCLVTLLEQEVASSPGTLGQVTSGRQDQVSATEQSNRSNVAGRQWRSGDGRDVALYCGDGRKSTSDVLVQLTQNKGTQALQFQRCQGRVTITLNLPEWRDGSNKEKDTIYKHFKEIIIMAAEKGYMSLTVLLDECQQCGWKERKACKLLVRNTLYSLQREHAGPCSCAYFIRDQETFMTLRDVIDASFRDTTQEFLSITDDKDEVVLDWEHVHQSDIEERKGQIVLQKGELAKMACDVIVNTTDKTLSLANGAVSASILREAGPEIQKECTQYHYSGVKYGEVAVTHGYKLKCEHVFHGALPSYGKDQQLKCMISFLWRCLTVADKKRYRTISFPALGTGNLGYPRDLVAKTMFDTVNSYFSEGKDSSIETVSFVVYPKDTPTVKAFQDEEQKQKVKVLQATSKPTPPVSERTAQLQLRYGPVDLLVTVGQIDTATADGLLIFWDYTSLYKSPLPCSYFNESINQDGVNQLRSKQTNMSSKGMTVVTGAGSLNFKSVIHCLIKEDTIDLQTVMSVLAEADNRNLSSVVLPLGTKEPLSRLKAQFVNQFHDALRQFGRRNKTLRRVEIMFDSVGTYQDTEKYIRSKYPDRLVENQTVTGEEPLGATGGLQTRSMTREANAKRTSDGNSTQTMYRTNLVVAGKLEDTVEEAIQQLKNTISTIQTQHQSELIPSPAGTTTHQNSPKPVQPPDTAPWDSLVKGDYNSSPVAKRTILESMEYEGRRLILKSKYVPTLEKAVVEDWLKKSGFENFTVIWPFLHDMEALIILQSSNDADKLLKKPSDQYTMNKFPCQVVQILRAPLKAAVVNTIKKCIRPDKICFEMFQASGATWFEDNGICFLEGSLPELQCATFYISNITAGENVHRGFQQISDAYGYDALERTKENNLCHVYPVQIAMKRNVQVKKRPPLGSEVLQTKQGVRVFVYQGNLLDLDVDAIIHGANCSLYNFGGLAGKIAIAAGPELEKACSDIYHEKGKLNFGDCCVTTSGNLHYKFIIHAVIPVWSYYRPHNQHNRQICQDDLTRSILNSLVEAGNAGARSVALPAVGKGHNPTEMCTAAYKEAVNLFCKKHQNPAMAEIHFVDQDKDILRKVSDVFLTSKPQVTSPAPPAGQNVKRTIVYPFWLGKHDTGGTLQLNDKLFVSVMKKSFMDTQASALVSIEDERFQSQRYVAKEIEKKAGKRYKKEKEEIQKGKKPTKISDVFHTSAGDLRNVLYVLHAIAPAADSSTSHDKVLWKGITDSIRACFHQVFRKVDELKLDSVALPSFALGTLQDGQTEELWQICVEEVIKFTKHQKSTSQLTRIILADPSAKTISFLMGLLDSMQQLLPIKETRM